MRLNGWIDDCISYCNQEHQADRPIVNQPEPPEHVKAFIDPAKCLVQRGEAEQEEHGVCPPENIEIYVIVTNGDQSSDSDGDRVSTISKEQRKMAGHSTAKKQP